MSARSDDSALAGTSVLANAHAHNDYNHAHPLRDALDNGFSSVEADVWLVDGALLVGHELAQTHPLRTLDALYLQPLAARVRAQHGRVYPDWPHSVVLLVDIKSEAEPTYRALHAALALYGALLSRYEDGEVYESALTVLVSGNRPRALMQAQSLRYAFYDGRIADLGGGAAEGEGLVPLVSEAWPGQFAWAGEGLMPARERAKLRAVVRIAHRHGQRVRFWGTPDTPGAREAVWRELLAADVDYINTDDLTGLRDWLLARAFLPSAPVVDWFIEHDALFDCLPSVRTGR